MELKLAAKTRPLSEAKETLYLNKEKIVLIRRLLQLTIQILRPGTPLKTLIDRAEEAATQEMCCKETIHKLLVIQLDLLEEHLLQVLHLEEVLTPVGERLLQTT